jgi:hypothetical protein
LFAADGVIEYSLRDVSAFYVVVNTVSLNPPTANNVVTPGVMRHTSFSVELLKHDSYHVLLVVWLDMYIRLIAFPKSVSVFIGKVLLFIMMSQ